LRLGRSDSRLAAEGRARPDRVSSDGSTKAHTTSTTTFVSMLQRSTYTRRQAGTSPDWHIEQFHGLAYLRGKKAARTRPVGGRLWIFRRIGSMEFLCIIDTLCPDYRAGRKRFITYCQALALSSCSDVPFLYLTGSPVKSR